MPNIHQEVLIAAPAKTVYDAVTTSEGLSGWWTPNSKATGQLGSIASFPFGPDYTKEAEQACRVAMRKRYGRMGRDHSVVRDRTRQKRRASACPSRTVRSGLPGE
jgi:hypothetical protein